MDQPYPASQEAFIQALKPQRTLKSLESSSIDLNKSKSLSKLRQLHRQSQQLVQRRFDDHLSSLRHSIRTLQQQCSKFGGIEFIRSEMDRNQLGKGEYVDYCLSRINKHFQLPVIKTRTLSQRSLKPKKADQYNKWYIQPQERFSRSKEATKYEWSKEGFINNIIKREVVMDNKYLPGFIAHSKEKANREPLFCKYAKVKGVAEG